MAVARLLVGVLRGDDARNGTVGSGKDRRAGFVLRLGRPHHRGQREHEDHGDLSHDDALVATPDLDPYEQCPSPAAVPGVRLALRAGLSGP